MKSSKNINFFIHRQNAFSMVELLIAASLGLIIILSVMGVYVKTTKDSRALFQSVQLSEELTALGQLIKADLKRAGFWSGVNRLPPLSQYPYALKLSSTLNKVYFPFNLNLSDSGDCISFATDVDPADGDDVKAKDLFAYRLKDKQIQSLGNVNLDNFIINACANNAGRWESLTDKRFVIISRLNFSKKGSQCFNLDSQEHSQKNEHGTLSPCLDIAMKEGDRIIEMRLISLFIQGRLADKELGEKEQIQQIKLMISIPNHHLFQYLK